LKVTMMDAALNTQKQISQSYHCIGFVRMAPAPARKGVIVTAKEASVIYRLVQEFHY